MQEALLRAWRRIDTLHDEERFEAWLVAICRREALRRIATQADWIELQTPGEDAPADDPMARIDDRLALQDVIGRLPPTDRRLMWLRFGEDRAHRQVADMLGMTETAVRIRVHRLRRRLSLLDPSSEM